MLLLYFTYIWPCKIDKFTNISINIKWWSKALIIPILKPGKDPLNPKSYRPISLLSCLYKILDTIINNRLIWFLEKNSLLDKCQSGGRKNRNTMDHVCTITTEIQEAFALGKYHISK